MAAKQSLRHCANHVDWVRACFDARGIACATIGEVHAEPTIDLQWRGETRTAWRLDERAFIEMHDRRAEFHLLLPIANWIRHGHPGLAPLEQPQFPDFATAQAGKLREFAQVFDAELATRPWWAGDRFSIADITAFCAIEFVRGLMRWQPGEQGLPNLQAWRDRVAARPSAKAGM